MTDERLLELAEYYSDNRKLVEYDRLNFEITSYVISQQELLKFAQSIRKQIVEEILTSLKDVPNPEANRAAINRIMCMFYD
jgi:hypothetical protein